MSNEKRFRTLTMPAMATVLDPGSERYKSVANQIEERFGFKPSPQIDLLYVESCLVTSNCNENDDAFLNDELWKARHTPVLKPVNWQHSEKDILGVVYSVQARNLNGDVIPFDQEEAPNEPFELFTEAVIFKLIHPDKAQEIADRHARGNLFVSMEAWFDNYDYVVVSEEGKVEKVVARNKTTAFLDQILKVNGGVGRHDGQRIGRGLRDITFGGYGFVDRPANKRSDITNVADMVHADGLGNEGQLDDLLRKFMSVVKETQPTEVASETEEIELMTATAGSNDEKVDVKALVAEALAEHKDAEKAEQAKAALNARAEELQGQNVSLTRERDGLQENVTAKDEEISTLKEGRASLEAKVNELVKAVAGATGSTPPEVAKIDGVTDGDSAFAAKISWIQESLKGMAARAARADELENELAIAARQLREEEIKNMFDGLMEEKQIEALITIGTAIEDGEEYDTWLTEKNFFALKLADAANDGKGKMPPVMDKKNKNKKEETACANEAVDAAIKFLQSESLGLSSGLNAGAIRTPRHKVAGSETANADPENVLANAKPEKGVNLAGAGRGDGNGEEEEKPAMRVLAEELFPKAQENDED